MLRLPEILSSGQTSWYGVREKNKKVQGKVETKGRPSVPGSAGAVVSGPGWWLGRLTLRRHKCTAQGRERTEARWVRGTVIRNTTTPYLEEAQAGRRGPTSLCAQNTGGRACYTAPGWGRGGCPALGAAERNYS